MQDHDSLIRTPEMLQRLGLSQSEFYRRRKAGTLKLEPVRLGPMQTRWSAQEVDNLVRQLLASRWSAKSGDADSARPDAQDTRAAA